MNKSAKLMTQIIMILFFVSCFPVIGEADEQGLGFSIRPIQPENQIDKDQTYFDLKMKPGQAQELEVVIRNNTDQEIIVEASVNAATTNMNGVLDYSWNLEKAKIAAKSYNQNPVHEKIDLNQIKYDSSLKNPLPSLVKSEKEVKVPAHSEYPYKLKLTMPDKSFDGIILGGVRFTEKESNEAQATSDKGVQIKNKFAYSLGIQLRETDTIVKPSLEVDQKKIKAASINGQPGITVNLQNPTMTLMQDVKVETTIYRKGSQKGLIRSTKEKLKMAPNSNFDYGIDWNNQPLRAGDYTIKGHVANQAIDGEPKEQNQKWEFEENFTITRKEANNINEQAVELNKSSISWWIYVVMGLLILLILGMAIVIIRHQIEKKKRLKRRQALKRKKQQANRNRTKRVTSSKTTTGTKRKE